MSADQSSAHPLKVAFFGNFLSGTRGGRSACEDIAERLEACGVFVVRSSSKLSPLLRLADMLVTAVSRRSDYEVAHVDVYSGRAFTWALCVSQLVRRLGRPYIVTLHGGRLPEFAAEHPIVVRRLLADAHSVYAPSAYLRDRMATYRKGIGVLPNAVDVAAYGGRARPKARPRLVWLRSFHSIYNPCLAVQVLSRLSVDYPEALLVMAGPDKGDGTLRLVAHEAQRLGVADKVRLVGNIGKRRIPELLREADIFLNTANVDNTPVSVLEAMAAGLCIVTTNVGGIPMLCTDSETALLVPPADVDAMTKACARLLEDDSLARRMSSAVLAEAASYDSVHITQQWVDALRSAADSHGRIARRG